MRENTLDEYIDFENHSSEKHEFIRGLIIAMTGGTPDHAALGAQVIAQLGQAVRRTGCRVYSSDLRIRIPSENVTVYPDASVICGKPITDEKDRLAILNPSLVVEVTSPSTHVYDRDEKYGYYQAVPTLREFVLVSHAYRLIEVYRRNSEGKWDLGAAASSGEIQLSSLAGSLNVDEIYEGLDIPAPPSPNDNRSAS